MNRRLRFSLLCLITGIGAIGIANGADPVTINITGNVKAAPCVVDGASSVPVDLGEIPAPALATVGSGSGWKPFKLNLKDCPASTTKVTAGFKGSPDATNAKLYANAGTAGTNVAIELAKEGGLWLSNGDSWQVNVNATTHAAQFPLAVQANSVKGNVGPGTISAVIQVDFTYQ
ncbi:fimbrial protein [Serratia odorifera]|uniref:Fimbrial protein n=2 Tax=Serratia odorifera TaxID=618 RepID=D4E075_SEROD|nr:fimbrial protein [Serratia odorifera]EFE96716.1 fimbrial protein [Serratia odorifera DSM 4582]PNK91340.1 type 1 fimbrial protein [Serratia odorifera]RII72572.1 type 1 fimbrial protein [Serratia odorifera]VDZ56131.1 putative fimbrial protein SthD [Serratia odorifera]